jgi:putative hemolysin
VNSNIQHTISVSEKSEVFLDVEQIIGNKNPKLLKIIPRFVVSYLKRILHQDNLNGFINRNKHKKGVEFAQAALDNYGVSFTTRGLENVPDEGRFIFASNHPLGAMDGIAFIVAVSQKFKNMKFPVNDILMSIKSLDNIFIPINKHGANSKNAARQMVEAYGSNEQMLMFPAGLCSRKQKGKIIDLDWKKNFINKAIDYKRDIIPVHINGRNTNFFYNLANFRKAIGIKANIEMLFLVDELYKQNGTNLIITFGKPVSWTTLSLEKDKAKSAQKLKKITYGLKS